jgi:hypothetical protein
MEADEAESMANQLKMEAEKKADKEELMARMDARLDANERKMDSNQERTDANLKAMKADQREMKAELNAWLGEMKACREATESSDRVTHVCLEERKEPAPEETEVVAER